MHLTKFVLNKDSRRSCFDSSDLVSMARTNIYTSSQKISYSQLNLLKWTLFRNNFKFFKLSFDSIEGYYSVGQNIVKWISYKCKKEIPFCELNFLTMFMSALNVELGLLILFYINLNIYIIFNQTSLLKAKCMLYLFKPFMPKSFEWQ